MQSAALLIVLKIFGLEYLHETFSPKKIELLKRSALYHQQAAEEFVLFML